MPGVSMKKFVSCVPMLVMLLGSQAIANDDRTICDRLIAQNKTGLFAVQNFDAEPIRFNGNGIKLKYSTDVRFFFIPSYIDKKKKELAWHARSQTTSNVESKADEALVWRRSVERCSPRGWFQTGFFPQFSIDGRFVSLGLGSHFHFELTSETPTGKICPRTDKDGYRAAYRFTNGTAAAAPHGSLISEILIADTDKPCLRVQTPLPTQSPAWNIFNVWPGSRTAAAYLQAGGWKPIRTHFAIRQLPYGQATIGIVIWEP